MSAWEDWKKELNVAVNIYEVWRHNGNEELILLMRAWDVYVVVVKLTPKGPVSESISVLELNREYNSTNESIGNFLSAATKKYGGAERVRELILSIERPGLNPTLKDLEMAKKATKTAAVKKSTETYGVSLTSAPHPTKKNAAKVEAPSPSVILNDIEKLKGELLTEIGGWLKKRKNPPSRQQVLDAFVEKGHPKVNVACCITAGVRSGALSLR